MLSEGGKTQAGTLWSQTRDDGCLDHKNSNRDKHNSNCLRPGNWSSLNPGYTLEPTTQGLNYIPSQTTQTWLFFFSFFLLPKWWVGAARDKKKVRIKYEVRDEGEQVTRKTVPFPVWVWPAQHNSTSVTFDPPKDSHQVLISVHFTLKSGLQWAPETAMSREIRALS